MWPSVISNLIWAITVAGVIFFFKKQIQSILNSISDGEAKIKIGSLIEFRKQKELNLMLNNFNDEASKYEKAFQSPIITEEEHVVYKKLVHANLTNAQAIKILINHLVNTQLNLRFTVIDKLISDGQIKVLQLLNFSNLPLDEDKLLPFNKKNSNENELYNNPPDKFLGLLTDADFIHKEVEGYRITLLGKEYLHFLVKIGRTAYL
jgi:hypothetical protein